MHKAMKNSPGMKLIICLIVYFGYVLNIMYTDGGFARKVVYGVFSLAMARAAAGVGLGYLLGNLYDETKERWTALYAQHMNSRVVTALITFTEIGSFCLLMMDFLLEKGSERISLW